jgi:hypothetical protein
MPFDVEVDNSGNVYVADFANDIIRQISPSAVVTTFAGAAGIAGSVDGLSNIARFNGPTAVSLDSSGRVYVADFNNNTIRRIANGVVRTIAGVGGSAGSASGSGGIARLNGPGGVITDAGGKTYVADTNNQTIRLLQTSSPGIECRNGGTGSHQIILDFANPVSATAASVTVDPAVSGATGNVSSFFVSSSEVTINLTSVSNVQTMVVRLSDVNDGTSFGDVSVPVSLLQGDTNANGAVNASDVSQTKTQLGQSITNSNFRTDVNANGTINASDVAIVKSHVGTSVP